MHEIQLLQFFISQLKKDFRFFFLLNNFLKGYFCNFFFSLLYMKNKIAGISQFVHWYLSICSLYVSKHAYIYHLTSILAFIHQYPEFVPQYLSICSPVSPYFRSQVSFNFFTSLLIRSKCTNSEILVNKLRDTSNKFRIPMIDICAWDLTSSD